MVRLRASYRDSAVLASMCIWKRTAAFLCLATALNVGPVFAVSSAQLDNTQSQIQNLNQSISAEENRISILEKAIADLEHQVLETRKNLREERFVGRKQLFDARRDLKRQEFEIESIEKDIALVNFDIDNVKRDMERDQQRFREMNVLKQSLEEGEFKKRQEDFTRQAVALEEKKAPLLDNLNKAKANREQLMSVVASVEGEVEDSALDKDPRLAVLLQKRERTNTELTGIRNQLRNDQTRVAQLKDNLQSLNAQLKKEQLSQQPKAAATDKASSAAAEAKPVASSITPGALLERTDYGSYVFVISGDQEPDIEQTLHLKNWVESYGAKYIQANWNGFDAGNGPNSTAGFKDVFRSYISQIPKQAKIVLIGHGLGGGAAIEAATDIAFSESRTIDFLAVLDPIGPKNLRANIVYETEGSCSQPDLKDEMTNSDYVECIKSSHKRMITSNIRYFYNRWQKDAQGPLDYQRQIPSLDANGKVINVPTATGRFTIAENIGADQKRLYFAGDKNAHRLLLAEEAKQLPKLLVQHLR